MMEKWKIQRHKVASSQQELQVAIIVGEMRDHWAYDSQSWCDAFKERLSDVKRTNSFSAENGYKGTLRNENSLEVWKLKANGDFNYKMFTVTKNS